MTIRSRTTLPQRKTKTVFAARTKTAAIDWAENPPPTAQESLRDKYGEQKADNILRSILPSAPARLVYLLGHIGKGDQILMRLLTDQRMRRPWTEIGKRIANLAQYDRIWGGIVTAHQQSGSPMPSRAAIRDHFSKISDAATTLSNQIAEGKLDRHVYQFYPDEVAVLNFGAAWRNLDDFERDQIAQQSMGGIWPSLREVLDVLAARASELSQLALTEDRVAEKLTRDRRVRYFAQSLSEYFRMPKVAANSIGEFTVAPVRQTAVQRRGYKSLMISTGFSHRNAHR